MDDVTADVTATDAPGVEPRLAHLYYVVWEYQQVWRIEVPPGSPELFNFSYVEGEVEGRLSGRFHGTNHGWRRGDETFLPDVQGVIECDNGATVGFDFRGYGCPEPKDRKRVVVAVRHYSDHPHWAFLNDSVAVGIGENRMSPEGTVLAMIEVFEVLWQPLVGREAARPRLEARRTATGS